MFPRYRFNDYLPQLEAAQFSQASVPGTGGTTTPPRVPDDEGDGPPFFPMAEGGMFEEPLWASVSEFYHPELVIDEGDPTNSGVYTEPTVMPLSGPGAVIPLEDPFEGMPLGGSYGGGESMFDANEPTFEDFQRMYGYSSDPMPQPGQPRGFMDHLGMAAAQTQFPRARNFGEGLLGGLAQGFGRATTSRMQSDQARQQFTAAQNKKNAEATARARMEWGKRGTDMRREKREAEKHAAAMAAANAQKETPEQRIARMEAESAARARGAASVPLRPQPQKPMSQAERRAAGAAVRSAWISDPDVKDFVTIRDNFKRVQSAANSGSGIGDLAVIFSYMRVLDPQSTVREGEFNNASDAIGKIPALTNTPSKWLAGNRLTAEGRKGFVEAAKKIYESKLADYRKADTMYREWATEIGADPNTMLRDLAIPDGEMATPAPAAKGAVVKWKIVNGKMVPDTGGR